MKEIYSGFAKDLGTLNQSTSRQSTVWQYGMKAPYAGPVHIAVVGENLLYHQQNIKKFIETQKLHEGVYAGAAGFINLSYAACSKASAVVLFDINAYQKMMWSEVFNRVSECKNAADFRFAILDIVSDIKTAEQKSQPLSLQDSFRRNCTNAGGSEIKAMSARQHEKWVLQSSVKTPDGLWMHNEKLYAHIRALVLENAIGSITLDISSKSACAEFKDYLQEKGALLRILYVSNILNFMESQVRSTDFIGRPLTSTTQNLARKNLYSWMEPDGKIIECDNLRHFRPLIISAEGFRPREPVLAF